MQETFTPYELEVLARIVDQAYKPGYNHIQREAVAIRILSFAQSGVRDYDALLAIGLGERTQTTSDQ